MKRDELIIFRDFTTDDLFERMTSIIDRATSELVDGVFDPGSEKIRTDIYECIHLFTEMADLNGFFGNLWHCYIANLLVNEENSYSVACEIRGNVNGSINDLALHDMEIIREYFLFDLDKIAAVLDIPMLHLLTDYQAYNSGSKFYNTRVRDRICKLNEEFERASNAEEMLYDLTRFYGEYGVGKIGLHKAFRVEESDEGKDRAVIVPIRNIRHVKLDDLVGYEIAKKKLVDNTEAFVAGRPANNCLLYGEAGTGKSSSIKAITNTYYGMGLRVIEIYRHQFRLLNDVISQIKNRNYRFIIYMDDLSFEEFETEYKYLKAVIEGGLEKKPENVLIYATSNRRHLIKESFRDRDGVDIADKHGGDTVQEKLSLAGRFGVSIYYGAPSFDEYQEIVAELADRYGVTMDKDTLRSEATKWQMRHGGLSGRTAQQFIDYVLGTLEEAEAEEV